MDKTTPYLGNGFTMNLLDGWEDKSIHVITGPVSDSLQHNIVIETEPAVDTPTLDAYAQLQIESLKTQLKGVAVLKQDVVLLDVGLPAYRVMYTWKASEAQRYYQEQLYILHQETGYRLTATFSRKSRKLLGADVERVMLGFIPGHDPSLMKPLKRSPAP